MYNIFFKGYNNEACFCLDVFDVDMKSTKKDIGAKMFFFGDNFIFRFGVSSALKYNIFYVMEPNKARTVPEEPKKKKANVRQ